MHPLLKAALRRTIRTGQLRVIDAGGEVHRFGPDEADSPSVRVRFLSRSAERQIVTRPSIGAAEAFMNGDLVIEDGDVMALASLFRSGNPYEEKSPVAPGSLGSRLASLRRRAAHRFNHRRAAAANVAHHYDLDDRLYDHFLDPWRQYSCAYWREDTPDLAAAQRAKIAHIAAKLELAPGQEVLDIGCGWGGLAIALHRLSGANVTGITLSREQLAYAQDWARREGVDGAVRFRLIDFRDVGGHFDRIVSVGMFEHVGVAQYGAFFAACRRLLASDGVMLLHSIARMGGPGKTDAFTQKYIFPGGYIPALSEVVPAAEASRLILTDLEVLRLHYARTLRAWYEACTAVQGDIEAVYDARFFRMWSFYLAGATAAFEHGGMVNVQLQYARDRRTLPLTRDYMLHKESDYRAALDAMATERGEALP